MDDLMWPALADLRWVVPVVVFVLLRWCSKTVRQLPARRYRPIRTGHREALTVVVPVYQEDPGLFRRALRSWHANDVDEVICVVNVLDEECAKVAWEHGATVVRTTRPDKREAIVRGWRQATTPLVALVDSDAVWEPDVAAKVCEPFAEPAVGGVCTSQRVLGVDGVWTIAAQMYLHRRYARGLAAQTVMGQALSCLSGRTAVYRRDLLVRLAPALLGETFLGVRCVSGDDKRLTMLTLAAGFRTVLQRDAVVWSVFPARMGGFARQRLRHARNTWRSDLRALATGFMWRQHPFLACSMFDRVLGTLGVPAGLCWVLTIGLAGGEPALAVSVAGWWLGLLGARTCRFLLRGGHSVRMLPALMWAQILLHGIRIAALVTVRSQGWLTRSNVDVGGGMACRFTQS